MIEAEPEATAKRLVAGQRFIETRMDLCKLISEQSEVHLVQQVNSDYSIRDRMR